MPGLVSTIRPPFTRLQELAQQAMEAREEAARVEQETVGKARTEVAVAEETLFRRGNFNGTFDQVICDALREMNNAQISLSPGFRWGTTVLPGQKITMYYADLDGRREAEKWRVLLGRKDFAVYGQWDEFISAGAEEEIFKNVFNYHVRPCDFFNIGRANYGDGDH